MSGSWGGMNPNSANQLWSEWIFTVYEGGRHVPLEDVRSNFRRWIRKLFGSAGRVRIEEKLDRYVIVVQVEGVAAHDPSCVAFVRDQFQKNFVAQGWGVLASSRVSVRIMAGDQQDGAAASQLVVIPLIE